MSLESGHYVISSVSAKCEVGRYYIEDLSLLPKRIVTLNGAHMGPASRPWIVQKVGDDKYKLKANGAPVGERNGLLFAHLIEFEGDDWCITRVENHGENAYVIEKADKSAGWVTVGNEDGAQLAVRRLIVGLSIPPFYPPNEVFTIVRGQD